MRSKVFILLLGVATLAGVLVLVSSADGRPAAEPVTVVAVAGPILAVAQDRSRIAWRACGKVVARDLSTRTESQFPVHLSAGAGPTCKGTPGSGLAIAGARVVWTEATSGIHEYLGVLIGTGRGKPHSLGELNQDQYGEGDSWSDLAADGETVVQGRARYARDEACVEANDGDRFACPALVVGGGVWRILDRSAVRVPKAPATTRVAVAGDRLALVPERAGEVVEVRNVRTGALMSRTPFEGQPGALAMSPSVAAVLVKGQGIRVVVLDPNAGAIRRTIPMPSATAPALALSGRTLVYRVGLRLWRVDAVTGRRATAAVTGSKAVSLEGRRLAWVETHRGRSRVRTVVLPG